MKIEVPISKDSEEYISKVFSAYEEVDEPITEINRKCVLHLYPKEDTVIEGEDNLKGNLKGFIDSMLCELHVYDVGNGKVYKHRYCDGLFINGVLSQSTRIFKDLSTMVIISEPVDISYYTSVEVESPNYLDMVFGEYE